MTEPTRRSDRLPRAKENDLASERRNGGVELSLAVPIYNEEAVLPVLFERLRACFAPAVLERAGIARLQIVMVDDGSRDASAELIREEIEAGAPISLVCLSRNSGHQAAVVAGLDHADGDVGGVLNADLQDPSEEILTMLERWRDGYDVVYAERRRRPEPAYKRFGYWSFYKLLSWLTEGLVPGQSSDFCVMDRRVVEAMRALPERLCFVRGLRAWVGFRQIAHPYDRDTRAAGSPKYNLRSLYTLATDGIASSSVRPLQVTQGFATVFFFLTIVTGVRAGARILLGAESDPIVVRLDALIALVSLIGFSILASLYVLSAYVARTYLEVKGRPPNLVREVVSRAAGSPERS
jgi:dolichol-phosphate mannosyltransferase